MRVGNFAPLLALLLSCAGHGSDPARAPSAQQRPQHPQPDNSAPTLQRVARLYESSDYGKAEALARQLLSNHEQRAEANLWLARVLLATGRYPEAERHAHTAFETSAALNEAARVVLAQTQHERGQLQQAEQTLQQAAQMPQAWAAKRLLGELYIEQGRRAEAEPLLLQLIDAYNDERISASNAEALRQVGRAAHLLRSPADANDAYIEASEARDPPNGELLLWHAETFLGAHDVAKAHDILAELLGRAPHDARALALMAQVKLAQTMNFASAEALARAALEVNPRLTQAHFVLAGVRLRDLELSAAREEIEAGLAENPRDLPLLSLLATAHFLAGDAQAFERVEQQVLQLNAQYGSFYTTVSEYADWEHRYQDIVNLLGRAVIVDPQDAQAHAGLGLNLIRLGEDNAGRVSLKRAFAEDPFNVRVYNTLNLFEQVIDTNYETVAAPPFRFRFARDERPVLERYVPAMMSEAFGKMVGYYQLTPNTPLGVELYGKREYFAVRTSGLPTTGIQGVCFGQTLAVVTPAEAPLNLGMTLWHELAHVFHIQLSHSRVPRWFTEGLAEYETLVARPEWTREHDLELYKAWQGGRLPKVLQMNRAFSHARSMQDIAVAYYASSQILSLLAERYGRDKLRQMLQLWGEGKSTAQVLQEALGITGQELDRQFDAYLGRRLQRYRGKFVASEINVDPLQLQTQLERSPRDRELRLQKALLLLEVNKPSDAARVLAALVREDAQDAQASFAWARALLLSGEPEKAKEKLQSLLARGQDGYEIQLSLARSQQALGQDSSAALQAAHEADPTQEEVLFGLWQLARQAGDIRGELRWLHELAPLARHSPDVYQRYLELLLQQGRVDDALAVGQSAVFVDIEGMRTHLLYAQALLRAGRWAAAQTEFDSALLCRGSATDRAQAHLAYAEALDQRGQRGRATEQRELAAQLQRKLDNSAVKGP